MNLSILICSVIERQAKLNNLLGAINDQIVKTQIQNKVEVCVFQDNFDYTIGEKRNSLLKCASGKFLVFVDDDDEIHITYCKRINEIIENKNIDYIGYRISRIFDGIEQPYEYRSIHFNKIFRTIDKVGYRTVSHTNPILAEIAKNFKFESWNSGEDADWCQQIHESKLIKKEHFINESMYIQHYNKEESLSKAAKDSGNKKLFSKKPSPDNFDIKPNYNWVKWL